MIGVTVRYDEVLEHCRAKGIDAHVMDFLHLDFPASSFDAVFAMNCLLHVPNQDLPDVLTAIRTVLRPDGLFFLGGYGDRDGQLTAFIQANFPGAVTPAFAEYDIDFRPTRRTHRNARRIVRDLANGHLFYTDDHYANFHLVVFQNLPDVDDAEPSVPPADPPASEDTAPNTEETAGDPDGGVTSFQSPDPTVFLPIEDPDKEVEWDQNLGQADENGDHFYGSLASTFGAVLLAILFFVKG